MSQDNLTFEDHLLLALVDITGDAPLPLGKFIGEEEIAPRVTDLLGVTPDFVRSPEFSNSEARLRLLAGLSSLEGSGQVNSLGTMGREAVAPTPSGRERVRRIHEQQERRRAAQVQEARTRVLDELGEGADWKRLDLPSLARRAGILVEIWELAVSGLIADGLLERDERKPAPLLRSPLRLTPAARAERTTRQDGRLRSAEEAWNEVARLRRELDLARQELGPLIRDEELRRRCGDLLTAGAHFDRAVREACVVLEARVRSAIGAGPDVNGVSLMELAFGTNGQLRLSGVVQEQIGAMQIYRGVMAFYRNPAGHRLVDAFARDDALRVVVWIDHLLRLIGEAAAARPDAATG